MLALTGGSAFGRTPGSPPDGIHAGRWILAPYFITTVGVDDNLFRVHECGSEDDASCEAPQSSTINSFIAGLAARAPFRNSVLELRYEAEKLDFGDFAPSRDLEQTAGALFQFKFGTGDTLTVTETYTQGITDVRAIDEGGELEFEDAPFNLNRIEAVWRRTHPLRQGFVIRLARVDLNFDGDELVPFFDYRGFEAAAEYRQPIPGMKWLTFYYGSRRFNHYEANDPDSVGIPFRKEEGDTLQVGAGGTLRGQTPFNLLVGYGKYRLLGTGSEYKGIVGSADVAILVASRTNLVITLRRRPWASQFDTYYIVNSLIVRAERPFMREFMVGVQVEHARNRYGEPIDMVTLRKDRRYGLEAYFDWLVHPRMSVRVGAAHVQRNSNDPVAEYEANAITAGVRLGWF